MAAIAVLWLFYQFFFVYFLILLMLQIYVKTYNVQQNQIQDKRWQILIQVPLPPRSDMGWPKLPPPWHKPSVPCSRIKGGFWGGGVVCFWRMGGGGLMSVPLQGHIIALLKTLQYPGIGELISRYWTVTLHTLQYLLVLDSFVYCDTQPLGFTLCYPSPFSLS